MKYTYFNIYKYNIILYYSIVTKLPTLLSVSQPLNAKRVQVRSMSTINIIVAKTWKAGGNPIRPQNKTTVLAIPKDLAVQYNLDEPTNITITPTDKGILIRRLVIPASATSRKAVPPKLSAAPTRAASPLGPTIRAMRWVAPHPHPRTKPLASSLEPGAVPSVMDGMLARLRRHFS